MNSINYIKKGIFLLLLFGASLIPFDLTLAQNDPAQVLDNGYWKQLTDTLDYSEDLPEEDEEEKDKETEEKEFSNPDWSGGISGLANTLIILIVTALVVGILVFILNTKTNKKDKKIDSSLHFDLDEAEDNLIDAQLQPLLDGARQIKDYNAIIRANYLQLLQKMALSERISWRKEKTNLDYNMELRDPAMKIGFRSVTKVFDEIRYGEAVINQLDYEKWEPLFNQLFVLVEKPYPGTE